jgi:hypothetical protein
MDCLRFTQLAQRYADADLGPVHRRLLEAHAAACDPCAATLQDYEVLFGVLGSLERETAPADLEAAVLARVDVRAFCPSARERLLRLFVHPEEFLPSPAQMGVAVGLVLGVLLAAGNGLAAAGLHLSQLLGEAATWTYVRITGMVAGAAARFLSETWPMIQHTARTLSGALQLLLAEHEVEFAAVACAVVLAAGAALLRARSRGQHAASQPL